MQYPFFFFFGYVSKTEIYDKKKKDNIIVIALDI